MVMIFQLLVVTVQHTHNAYADAKYLTGDIREFEL
jgi:hypothetical protein